MPDNIEVPFINLQGHALECYRFLRDLDYLLVTQIQSPGKYFLLPPPGNLSSDPPAEIKFKRQDASYNRPTSLKNPIDAKNLAANLDNALRDELDL
ncbi:MAG TPA: hypothetical protein VKA15_26135, partial [Isosphaeraceae bacterium]|nr:hypothetical protein [Isosphaeraceae bacterium]